MRDEDYDDTTQLMMPKRIYAERLALLSVFVRPWWLGYGEVGFGVCDALEYV